MLPHRFRWTFCQLEVLRHCLPPSIRGILDELPETLDETYERVLKNINKANQKHAIRLLHCLTVAIRPLRVEELAEVLAVDFDAAQQGGIPKLNPNWRWANHHQAVLSTCSSLIAIVDDDDGSQVVQFSHFSVKEYLTSDRLANASEAVSRYYILPESAHTILAQACLGVLLRLDDHVNGDTAWDIPLANYAAEHWVVHAQFKNVSSCIQDAMESFFDADKPHYTAWLRLHNIDGGWSLFRSDPGILAPSPLYYASLCGFYDLAKYLAVKHPERVTARGGINMCPLGAAVYRNHYQVAELLCEHGADINVRGNYGWMLLHAASYYGEVNSVRWLLNHGADANAQADDGASGWNPLHLAVANGHLEVARVLLEHNADINARDVRGQDALHLVVSLSRWNWINFRDWINFLRLLLDHGADINARDHKGSTPLHHSSFRMGDNYSEKRSVEISRMLLEHGASIDAENNKGETPFLVALEAEHHEMVEFLWGLGTN
jgi:ankyrin repeat protein